MRNKYMKRTPYVTWLVSALLVFTGASIFICHNSRAESGQNTALLNKVSPDLRKMAETRGTDKVRVVIQPAGAWEAELDFALQLSGAKNIRQFKNFNLHIVDLPAAAAAALAARKDIAYVSLNS